MQRAMDIVTEAFHQADDQQDEIGTTDKLLPFILDRIQENGNTVLMEMQRLQRIKEVVFDEEKIKDYSFEDSQLTIELLRAIDNQIEKLPPLKKISPT
jgi:hypothetical protein